MDKEHMTENSQEVQITISLSGQPMESGRIYVTSPDLRGFHFILEPDDDPIPTMIPALETFIPLYLKAGLIDLKPTLSTREYRASKLEVSRPDRNHNYNLVAAVA